MHDPFAPLVRKKRLAAALAGLGRRVQRPWRPSRIAPGRAGPPNLLIIGVDTLRWDHLSLAGYPRPTSPRLDTLARGGCVFTDVMAAAPWTLPSFASALTGLMPGLHGGRLVGALRNMDEQPPQRLDDRVVSLAGHLRRHGYRTAAFYANAYFTFGLAESFDDHTYVNLPAAEVCARAADWMRRHGDRPFVCFLLLNDPHEPTTPPPADLHAMLTTLADAEPQPSPERLRGLATWGSPGSPDSHLGLSPWPLPESIRHLQRLKVAIYDATIRAVDRAIGDLADQLARWHLDTCTITTVFSDHGEEFLDHAAEAHAWGHDPRRIRGIGHGHTQFQELLHVPWLSWGPGVPVGTVWERPVSLCDLAPTLLDWSGNPPLPLPAPACTGLVGQSLAPLVGAPDDVTIAGRWLLAEALAFGPDLVAVRRGRWKLIAHRDGRPLGLYDLADDPTERDDRQHLHADILRDMQGHLSRWRQATGKADPAPPGKSAAWSDFDDEVRKRLRDLGYGE